MCQDEKTSKAHRTSTSTIHGYFYPPIPGGFRTGEKYGTDDEDGYSAGDDGCLSSHCVPRGEPTRTFSELPGRRWW